MSSQQSTPSNYQRRDCLPNMASTGLCQKWLVMGPRYFRPLNFAMTHKPTKSFQWTLENVTDPLPTLIQRNVGCNILCSGCPNAYVGRTGRQFCTRGAVIRLDDKYSSYFSWRLATYLIVIESPSSEKAPPSLRAILSRHWTLTPRVWIISLYPFSAT